MKEKTTATVGITGTIGVKRSASTGKGKDKEEGGFGGEGNASIGFNFGSTLESGSVKQAYQGFIDFTICPGSDGAVTIQDVVKEPEHYTDKPSRKIKEEGYLYDQWWEVYAANLYVRQR